ncbi:hypothetical protein BOX37_13455 [Nocardia mangyaensis]|uniref:Uncharacterized protein n=1 Tax=Nocardia mangyaensis TaxID=2213200 RepID=A0A1J0VRZ5_9NOCA|nr:hypothetical protein [Nocardia mangyaensis]APE34785.1 hypothetical protein BOX37_13455 [Nocardia mangyaensis]
MRQDPSPSVRGPLLSAACALLLATAGYSVAGVTPASADAPGCSAQARIASLEHDRDLVLNRLGPLRTLRGPADLAAVSLAGWTPLSHGVVSYAGMGMVLTDTVRAAELLVNSVEGLTADLPAPLTVTAGEPAVLFYRSLATGADLGDPVEGDYPYELAGWGHLAKYTPGVYPVSASLCLDPTDWFVHERGIHALPSFDMLCRPPEEAIRGGASGALEPSLPDSFGIPHPRLWDTHIWLRPDGGTPTTAILDDVQEVAGVDWESHESFYFPGESGSGGHR